LNDTFILVLAIIGAMIAAMAFTAWRIHRLQYPPELRWPKEKKRRRRRRSESK
jgi:hypothetical protein